MLMFPISTVTAQDSRGENLDESKLELVMEYTSNQLKMNDIVGGVIGVVHKDKLVRTESYGVADLELKSKPSSKTIYSAASITKALTATAILKLHSEGLLDIDQPVKSYIPWFSFNNQEMSDQVTLKHLLIHAAGGVTSSQTDGLVFGNDQSKDSIEQYVRLFNRVNMPESPGQTGNYCNACYDALGLVIEYVTGMSYYEYMDQSIFDPLQMNDTMYGRDLGNIREESIAKEYTWFFAIKQHLERSYESFGTSQDPDGGAYSTIEDLGKYLSFLLGYSDVLLMDQNTRELMKSKGVPTETNTAYYTIGGFEAKQLHQVDVYYKTGDGIGSSTAILFIPKYDLGIALLLGESRPEIQQQLIEDAASIMMGYTPVSPGASMTFGKTIGYIAWILVAVGTFLMVIMIWRVMKKKVYTTNMWRAFIGFMVYGVLAFFLWYLILTVRPFSFGFYGYPYDIAIGLIFIILMSSSWSIYYLFIIITRRYVKVLNREMKNT